MIKKTQIYKIYINEVELILAATEVLHKVTETPQKTLIGLYSGKVKNLYQFIDMCEKNCSYDRVIVHYDDFMKLYDHFTSIFTTIEASGGLIRNENNEFLFIFRRGFWDLPKGKIENGESKKQAAIREVEEETGIQNVAIESKIGKTFHTYKTRSEKRIIKKSYWYLMKAPHQNLLPQAEEDIDKAEWITLENFMNNCSPVYKNIMDVIHQYQSTIQ